MKISIIEHRAYRESYLKDGMAIYENRIRHYVPFEMVYLQEPNRQKINLKKYRRKMKAGSFFLPWTRSDYPGLLDERGKMLSSAGFCQITCNNAMNRGTRNLGFVIGRTLWIFRGGI